MPWYTHAPTFADPDTGAFSEDFKGIVENFPAMARGENGSPYVEAGWHPYDGLTVGDGADGVIYDFAVDGAISSLETPDFADGYEYLIRAVGLSGDINSNFGVEFWRATTAAWSGRLAFATYAAGDAVTLELEILRPRSVANIMFFRIVTGAGVGGEFSVIPNADDRLYSSTAQKIGKARISTNGAPEFDAGKIFLFRRRCHV